MAGRFRFYFISLLALAGFTAGAGAQDDADSLPGSIYAAFEREPANPDGGADESETVIGAIRAALAHNPEIRLAEGRKDAAKADRFRALGGFLPNIEASAVYANDDWRSETLPTLTDRDGTTIGVTAVQPVFQGLSAINRYRSARASVSQSDLIVIAARQQTVLEAARAHAGVVLAREIVQHRIDNMGLVNRQLTVAQKRLEAGAQSRTGVEQSRMRLAQAQVDLGQARTVLAEQEAAYIRIVGRPPAANLVPDTRNIASAFASLDQAVDAARNNNPLIAAADFAVDAARHAKNAAKGEFAPDLTIEGSYFKRYGETEILAPENEEEYQLVARMRMPIFRQGDTIADLRGAGALVSQQEAQMTATLLSVEETVARSWRQWSEAQARATAARTGIEAAEQSVKGLEMEYNAGQRTVIDVLDGQRDLVIAQINASQAEFDLRASQYELAAATGLILEAFFAGAE